MNDRCPQCGALIAPSDKFCPHCGAPLDDVRAEAEWTPGTVPATIGQLKAFCNHHGMPLEKMRFYIDRDFSEPRAFGIYRDGDQFVVYKNKANGSRAVRYHGPDEAHAVGELYAKLLDECHQRDIWPDGKPQGQAGQAAQARRARLVKRLILVVILSTVVIIALTALFVFRTNRRLHAHDGYYRFDDDALYYLYGDTWYYDYDYDWYPVDDMFYEDAYTDYYLGDDYEAEWGDTAFEDSSAWEAIHEDRDSSGDRDSWSSSDYDSWDFGDTDWDSDW